MSNKEKLLASAQKYLQKGQIARAVKDYQKLVELEPRDVRLRQRLAELYSRDRRIDEALDTYEAVAKHYTDHGFYLKAIAVYKQMQKLEPSRVSVYHRLAELNEKQGLVGNAQAEYRSLVAYYEKNGMLPEAINVLQKMKELEPENLNIRVKIAETCATEGLQEKSLEEFREVLGILRQKQDYSRILKLYELFLPHFPEAAELRIGSAEAQIEQGEVDSGVESLQSLHRQDPENAAILLALARGYRKKENFVEEQETYRQLLKIAPENLDYHQGFILASLDQGAFEQALDELEEWKEAFFAAGKVQLLKTYYERLGDDHAGDERVLKTLRSIYELTGEGDKLFRVISAMPTADHGLDAPKAPTPSEEILEGSILQEAVEDLEGPELATDLPDESVAGQEVEPADADGEQAAEEIPLKFLEGIESEVFAPSPADTTGEEGEDPAVGIEDSDAEEEEVELELELDLDFDLGPNEAPTAEEDGVKPEEEAPGSVPVIDLDDVPGSPLEEADLELTGDLEIAPDEDAGSVAGFDEPLEEVDLVLDEEVGQEAPAGEADDGAESSIAQELEPAAGEYVDLTGDLLDDLETVLDGVGVEESDSFPDDDGLGTEVGAGVDEIDPEDAESHYNLGIAYKEMGLIDDAIAEFEKAGHNPQRTLDAMTLKGLCLLDKGAFAEAEAIFRSGLGDLSLSTTDATGLRFELGLLYQAWEKPELALETFEKVAAADPLYRNVGEKIAVLHKELGKGENGGRGGKKDRVSYV